MATLKSLISDAYDNGKFCYSTFRKVSANASVGGYWADLSNTPGTPVPNYYVGNPMVATVPDSWYKKGLWHGGSVSPYKKRLHKICILGTAAAVSPAPFILCDYLVYYPVIDMDSTDKQYFINYGVQETLTTSPDARRLPRYTTGLGVQSFLMATNPYVGGQAFQIEYTNSDGVSGRTSQVCLTNTATNIGTIVNSNTAGVNRYNAFIPLASGDRGIRQVDSITFFGANGGLAVLVLVKPLATFMTGESTAWAEFDFLVQKPILPIIEDGAYLNMIVMPSATIAAVPVIGEITTIWGL